MATVAETIREISRKHLLENKSFLYGQCLRAVGWVGGTVPELTEEEGIVELPTSDVSNGYVVCGSGLTGIRPIYVIRYQGFVFFNIISILTHSSKSKEMWQKPCPVFIRAIAMEGGIGPVASNSHHSMVARMPGIVVTAPMTPNEWKNSWDYFMAHDDPLFCSEHRLSFPIDYEIPDIIDENPEITIFAISNARLNALKAIEMLKDKIKINLINVVWLKPTCFCEESLKSLKNSKFGVVIDCDYEICGISTTIAYKLMILCGKPVYALGLKDRTAGFAPHVDNITPTATEIVNFIHQRH